MTRKDTDIGRVDLTVHHEGGAIAARPKNVSRAQSKRVKMPHNNSTGSFSGTSGLTAATKYIDGKPLQLNIFSNMSRPASFTRKTSMASSNTRASMMRESIDLN